MCQILVLNFDTCVIRTSVLRARIQYRYELFEHTYYVLFLYVNTLNTWKFTITCYIKYAIICM